MTNFTIRRKMARLSFLLLLAEFSPVKRTQAQTLARPGPALIDFDQLEIIENNWGRSKN